MKPLSETNPYLRDPQTRRRLLERNALDSSVFERRAVLPMPEPWRFAYERISEGHTAAVVNQQQHPGSEEAKALLHATSAAVRAFREVYEKTRMIGLAAQIGDLGE